MPLNELSHDELVRLYRKIGNLIVAGASLQASGIEPTYDLTPGCQVVIFVDFTMPLLEADPPAPADDGEFGDYSLSIDPLKKHSDGEPIGHWSPPIQHTEIPEPLAASAAQEGVAAGELDIAPAAANPISPAEAASVTGPDESDDRQTPEPAGEIAGAAREDAAPARSIQEIMANRWTEEEDAAFVEGVAVRMREGATRAVAIAETARTLDRPVQGAAYRANHKLIDRIKARLAELYAISEIPAGSPDGATEESAAAAAAGTQQGPEEPEGTSTAPEDGSAPAVASAGVPSEPVSELGAYLSKVKRDGIWTITRDRDLMHFLVLQWPANDIALELQVPATEIKPRIATLTASRKWKSSDVLAELERMSGAKAA